MLVLAVGPSYGAPPAFKLGVAVTPKNFPVHTWADVSAAFARARTLGDYAVFISQWGELDLAAVRAVVRESRQAGMRIILGLSPTTLAQDRKELDLPATLRRQAGEFVSFGNPVIRKAFKDAAADLARLQPAYLCLATEINFLALRRLDEYLQFASLYKEVYREVKRLSPTTKAFVSFQWEWMRFVDAKEPQKISGHTKVIDIFRPQLDVVALTSYPAPFHDSPGLLPRDYYSSVRRHIRAGDEVLFMEVGWPTRGGGSELEQEAFIRRLPAMLRGLNVTIVAWALLHDVALPEFGADLRSVGLLTQDGRPKPGYFAFQALARGMR